MKSLPTEVPLPQAPSSGSKRQHFQNIDRRILQILLFFTFNTIRKKDRRMSIAVNITRGF